MPPMASTQTNDSLEGSRYPFGEPVRRLVQQDRTPTDVFVLGVYASAVHARWLDAAGKTLVQALAVASEPQIFWDGSRADEVVSKIKVPEGAGTLRVDGALKELNGPSGRSLDRDFLAPLGVERKDAWLCDLVPHTCMNEGQAQAIDREYEPLRKTVRGLPAANLPSVPTEFANASRRAEVLEEIEQSKAKVVVLLGDEPIRYFLSAYHPKFKKLSDFGTTEEEYGRLHPLQLGSQVRQILPLVHPRQAARLGSHNPEWSGRHDKWKERARELVRAIVRTK
jgi:uracil-DNA glycosylase